MQIGLELWLFAVALGTSMLGGVLGMASGIFIVPILTMFGRIDIHTAIGASLVSVIACSCGSAAPFLKERLTNIRLAILLETATTSGALCGVFLAGLIPSQIFIPALRIDPVALRAANAGAAQAIGMMRQRCGACRWGWR